MKSKTNKIIIVLAILMILFVVFIGVVYGKYYKMINGVVTGSSAKIICETNVTTYNSSIQNVNPYCEISVRNYNQQNQVSEVSIDYTLTIASTNGETLPDYYCLNSEGVEVANSANNILNITGELGNTQIESDIYTLYFINTGDSNYTKGVVITTNAVQSR